MTIISHSQQNIHTILSSDVVARAVIKAGETRHIISVYAESSTLEFYWVNEEGKKAGTFHKESGPWKDFDSFIQYKANMLHGTIESSEIYSPEDLLAITAKPRHFAAIADWTQRIASTDPRDYRILNRRLESKVRNTPRSQMFWPGRK